MDRRAIARYRANMKAKFFMETWCPLFGGKISYEPWAIPGITNAFIGFTDSWGSISPGGRNAVCRLVLRCPCLVPEGPNEVWSADFMSDALYHGSRFRTFNILDDFNREVLTIEIDTSLRAERIIRVLERLKTERELPHMIRVDNGPEFLAQILQDWGKANRVLSYHIQPGHPTQNAFIERFNRTYRNEVLDLYLFRSLEEVREITAEWMTIYNEHRPHEALQGATPWTYQKPTPENSTYQLSA